MSDYLYIAHNHQHEINSLTVAAHENILEIYKRAQHEHRKTWRYDSLVQQYDRIYSQCSANYWLISVQYLINLLVTQFQYLANRNGYQQSPMDIYQLDESFPLVFAIAFLLHRRLVVSGRRIRYKNHLRVSIRYFWYHYKCKILILQ